MGAAVWAYHRPECDEPGCGWVGAYHLSPFAAAVEAEVHDEQHAVAHAVEVEILTGSDWGG